jgi:PAS domain S-box-containing protein
LRALIVDDHERVRRAVRLLLSRMQDVEVCGEAVDGGEAVAKAHELNPDVIIMDIDIPGLNGIEASREIHRLLPNIKIVVISFYDIPEAREEALRVGAIAYVTKSSVWRLLPILRKIKVGDFSGSSPEGSEPGIAMQGASQDRPDLENLLNECQERFLTAFEQMAVGMGHVDSDGRWLRVNRKLCDLIGYTKTEIRQLSLQDITHPADVAADQGLSRKVALGELDHYFIEKRYIHRDGRIVWIRLTVNAVRDAHGKLKYCLHVAEDATASKDAQARLAQIARNLQIASGKLDLVTSNMHASLSQCSRDLRYLWVSQTFADWLQRPIEKIIGHSILDVIGKTAFQTLQPHFDHVLRGEKISYKESVTYERIGTRHISASYSPTLDADGSVDGWIALVKDLTADHKPSIRYATSDLV